MVGYKREVEAEVNIGMSERKRLQLFQEKFQKVKDSIGYLNLDRKSRTSLWSILTSGKDILDNTLLQKLPIQVFDGDLHSLKSGKRKSGTMISGSNFKRTINEEWSPQSGTMSTFDVGTSSTSSNVLRNYGLIVNDNGEEFDDEEAFHSEVTNDNSEDINMETVNSGVKNSQVFLYMEDIVKALKSEMVMTSELGWFPTDHLSRASRVLEETQSVLMYSQVTSNKREIH